MSNFKSNVIALALIGLTSTAMMAGAQAAGPSGTAADYGTLAPATAAARTIVINGDTKWVNVENGETVQFSVGGQTFTWNFSTFPGTTSFDLSKISPAGVQFGTVRVYVASNPLYRG
jgi:phosphate-selective porin